MAEFAALHVDQKSQILALFPLDFIRRQSVSGIRKDTPMDAAALTASLHIQIAMRRERLDEAASRENVSSCFEWKSRLSKKKRGANVLKVRKAQGNGAFGVSDFVIWFRQPASIAAIRRTRRPRPVVELPR